MCLLNYQKIQTLELQNKIDHTGLKEVLSAFPELRKLKFSCESSSEGHEVPLQH